VEQESKIGLSLGWVFWGGFLSIFGGFTPKNLVGILGICPGVSTLANSVQGFRPSNLSLPWGRSNGVHLIQCYMGPHKHPCQISLFFPMAWYEHNAWAWQTAKERQDRPHNRNSCRNMRNRIQWCHLTTLCSLEFVWWSISCYFIVHRVYITFWHCDLELWIFD